MRTTLHGVVARFGSRALPAVACSASSARCGSIASRVPVVFRPLRVIVVKIALGAKDRDRFASALVKGRTHPRSGTSPSRERTLARSMERTLSRSMAPRSGESRRRSLDDAREGAARCLIRSLPTLSESSRCDVRLGAESPRSRAACVRPSGRKESEPVAMAGVHPHTPLARPPLAWELGPARELRATRVSCSTPRSVGSPCPLRCAEGSR